MLYSWNDNLSSFFHTPDMETVIIVVCSRHHTYQHSSKHHHWFQEINDSCWVSSGLAYLSNKNYNNYNYNNYTAVYSRINNQWVILILSVLINCHHPWWVCLLKDIFTPAMAVGLLKTDLKLVTFNCRSVKSSVDEIKQLCDSYDIIMLQEHLMLSRFHPEFLAVSKSAVNITNGLLIGRLYGELPSYIANIWGTMSLR